MLWRLLKITLIGVNLINTNGQNALENVDELKSISKFSPIEYKSYADIINNNNVEFKHNFCESRLQNNTAPEVWNANTALFITMVPMMVGFPKYPHFYNVACMLSFNGIASWYYHYYLNWMGKQGDEVSMILANYFGSWGLINMYYKQVDIRNEYNRFNTLFMYLFLVINTIVEYDYLFPSIFGMYVCLSLYLIDKIAIRENLSYKVDIFISLIGFSGWIISEYWCNERTVHGHSVWHILFPLGFYRILLRYDKKKMKY